MNNDTTATNAQKLLPGKSAVTELKPKTSSRKKVTTRKQAVAARRAAATRSRNLLVKNLKKDLEDTKATLKAARTAAKHEVAVLKDQLNAAMKREKELLRISEKKIRKMITAGERWEKKQLGKLKKAADKARNTASK